MALKYSYKVEADIPADSKGNYRQDGGEWVLDIEGDPVSEYRSRNITLQKERDEVLKPALSAYKDLGTVDELKKLVEIKGDLDVSKLVRSNKVDEAVEKRMEGVKAEHNKELQKEKERADRAQAKLETMMIDNKALEVGTQMGAKKTATTDIVYRLRNVFKVEDGKLVAYKSNGEKNYGKSGDGLTMEEAMETVKADAPHLFEENRGMDTDHSTVNTSTSRKTSYTGPNPWKAEEKNKSGNLGLRTQIAREDPALAKRLRQEAGLMPEPAQTV